MREGGGGRGLQFISIGAEDNHIALQVTLR